MQSIQPELDSDERVMWVRRPNARREAMKSLPILIFAIPWTSGSLSFLLRSLERGWFENLFIGTFVAVGVAMLLSPLWVYATSSRTVYAITDRRVIIVSSVTSKKVQTYRAEELSELTRTEFANGCGDLTFARQRVKQSDSPDQYRDVKLIGISDVRRVEAILRALKAR